MINIPIAEFRVLSLGYPYYSAVLSYTWVGQLNNLGKVNFGNLGFTCVLYPQLVCSNLPQLFMIKVSSEAAATLSILSIYLLLTCFVPFFSIGFLEIFFKELCYFSNVFFP